MTGLPPEGINKASTQGASNPNEKNIAPEYSSIRDALNKAFSVYVPQNAQKTGIAVSGLSEDRIAAGINNLLKAGIIRSREDIEVTENTISFTKDFLDRSTIKMVHQIIDYASRDERITPQSKLISDISNYTQINIPESQVLSSYLLTAASYKRYDNGEFSSKDGVKSTLESLTKVSNVPLDEMQSKMNSITDYNGINKKVDEAKSNSKLLVIGKSVEEITKSLKAVTGEEFSNLYLVNSSDIIKNGVEIGINPDADLKNAFKLLADKASKAPKPEIKHSSHLSVATAVRIEEVKKDNYSGFSRGGCGHDLYNAD